MKTYNANLFKLATLAGLVGAISCGPTQADEVVNRFDNAAEVPYNPPQGWRHDFGSVPTVTSWDGTQDGGGNPLSGSMKVVMSFNTTLGGNNKEAQTTDRWYPGLNGADYSSLSFDLKVDPNSALDAFGNNGFFSMAIRNTDGYAFVQQFGDNIRSADGWRHISVPLTGPYDHIRALTWQLYGGPSQNITGDVTLYFDNIVFASVPEPSTLALVGLGTLGLLAFRRRH